MKEAIQTKDAGKRTPEMGSPVQTRSAKPPTFQLQEAPEKTTAEGGETGGAEGDGKVYVAKASSSNIRGDDDAHKVTDKKIPRGTLLKVIETGTDAKGKAVVRVQYLDDATKQYWTTKGNVEEAPAASGDIMISGYNDVYVYTDPYSGTVKLETKKKVTSAHKTKLKVQYTVGGYQYAVDEAGAKVGWVKKSNLVTEGDQKRVEYLEEYKKWLVARKGEVDKLSGQAKLDRVRGILSQVEEVCAAMYTGTYTDLKTLSTSPTYSTTNQGTFTAPELVGTVRGFIEITEGDIESTKKDGTKENLAHSADAEIGGSNFSDQDWNTRLGVQTYRTQSDNLMPPEASCAPTSFTMAMERAGTSRADLVAAIDEKLSGHRKDSYRGFLWKQYKYREAEYLKTDAGKKAAAKGAVTVPDSFKKGVTPPADFTPTKALPAKWTASPIIPDDYTPSTAYAEADLKKLWKTKATAHLKALSPAGKKNYQKIRGNKGGLVGSEGTLATSFRDIGQMEDLVDFMYYLYGYGTRTGINSSKNQSMANRVQKPGYNTKEDNVSNTEKLSAWSPEAREKIREALDDGAGVIMSVFHKGSTSTGTHNVTVQSVTSTGLVIDDPFGKINPDYRRKSGTKSDMYIDKGKGSSPSTRDTMDWKNKPSYDKTEKDMTKRDFTVDAGHDLKANESRGDSTEISYAMLNESMRIVNYIVIYHRPK